MADRTDPSADAFDAAMAEDLARWDAELLACEGPDALTADRALRLLQFQAAQAIERQATVLHAEQDESRVGYVLAAFRARRGWSREQLADWLGIRPDDLIHLVVEIRPAAVSSITMLYDPEPINELADRHGVHRERLYEVFDQGDP
jgi:hypothetical protein